MSARELISGEAELADESDEESFGEETEEPRHRSNGTNGKADFNDSSEEEEDDDDEEAVRQVGFASQYSHLGILC